MKDLKSLIIDRKEKLNILSPGIKGIYDMYKGRDTVLKILYIMKVKRVDILTTERINLPKFIDVEFLELLHGIDKLHIIKPNLKNFLKKFVIEIEYNDTLINFILIIP